MSIWVRAEVKLNAKQILENENARRLFDEVVHEVARELGLEVHKVDQGRYVEYRLVEACCYTVAVITLTEHGIEVSSRDSVRANQIARAIETLYVKHALELVMDSLEYVKAEEHVNIRSAMPEATLVFVTY